MIDLSHLTEEEQGMIMTVLRRDAELKKAEEERIRKLEKILNSGPQPEGKLKYLTGEWFYEAKSRRHMDKIHGSEIILASMKPRRGGSLRVENSRTPSSCGSDVVAPAKPARCLEALQQLEINDAEKENQNSSAHSQRTPGPRHNPFNRASLIVVEPPENNNDALTSRDGESSEIELTLRNHPAEEASQTSGVSIISESSSVGFKPVPKKRTFLSRHCSSQFDINGLKLDSQVGLTGVMPAPRRSLQRGYSGSSNQSGWTSPDEIPQNCEGPAFEPVPQLAQPRRPGDETSRQPLSKLSQVFFHSSLDRERHPPSITTDRPTPYMRGDVSPDVSHREEAGLNTSLLHSSSIQDSERGHRSIVGTSARQEDLSLTQNMEDPEPPVSYDLNFIDKSDEQTERKHAFKLSTQATSPTGDEDSIAKVLDWFSRSIDSIDLLGPGESPKASQSSQEHADVSKSSEDSTRKDNVDRVDRNRETLDMMRSRLQRNTHEAKELSATDCTGNKEPTEAQEVVQKDSRERTRSHDVNHNDDERQPPKISHLKSFWEKSDTGPKILVGKSITPSDEGQKLVYASAEKEKEHVKKSQVASNVTSAPGTYSQRGIHDEYSASLISPQKDAGDCVSSSHNQQVDSLLKNIVSPRNSNDPTFNSDYLKLLSSPQVAERGGSDTEMFPFTRLSPQPNPQPDSLFQSRETQLQEEVSKAMPVFQLDMNDKQVGNDVRVPSNAPLRRGPSEDVERRDSKHKNLSSMSPKSEDVSNKEGSVRPHSNKQVLPHQESTAEKIKQLKSFWEQERNKSVFYTPKTPGQSKFARGANRDKLTKRFTKSEFDLRVVGNDSGSDEAESLRNPHHFTVLPLNQRIEKSSPSLSASRSQFNTLLEFWDDAASDPKLSFSPDKPKSPKRKVSIIGQPLGQEFSSGDPEIYRCPSTVEKPSAAVLKSVQSSTSPQSRSKSPHDRQTGSGSRAVTDGRNLPTAESKRSSKDSGREEKLPKSQNVPGKETRPPKSRRDTGGKTSSRGNSLRRATSMFALTVPDDEEQGQPMPEASPLHFQSTKSRQSSEKGATSRSPEGSDTPLARAFVPRDYRHYLGMTDESSVHTSLAPAVNEENEDGTGGKSGYAFDLSGPVKASTPVGSQERYSRKGGKTSQRPLWANHSSSDTGPASSVSSTSETWSISRNSSNRDNDDDVGRNTIRKALRRAEARPKNLTKSIEDITTSISPRQERKQEPSADLRRVSDASSIASPSSPLFCDPDHLKKMSKSVPSFLENEDNGGDAESVCEDSFHRRRLVMGRSMTNLSSSSGVASVSSLSGSVMTMYSADFGNVEVQGNIQFSINYVQRLREFHIFVAECQGLAAVDPKRGRSDPYVKSYLVPDKANLGKRKTSVKKKTLSPTFNEILRYRVRMEYLRTQTLILSAWHHDTFGRNSFLGEVDVDLSKWDFDHTQMNYLVLKARTTPTLAQENGRGEMKLAIRFLPQVTHSEGVSKNGPNTGEVHIWVKECKNLPLIRATIDPYVKCFVLPDTSRKSRQKTRVLRRTVDPVFNHTMVYDGISETDLTEACVEITVWDRDRLASNLLGGLRLGVGTGKSYGAPVDWMDSTSLEAALWQRMLASPDEWVEDVLPLRMVTSAKNTFK